SGRNNAHYTQRLFTVPITGGMPAEIPLPVASQGAYSPDGARLAYVPGQLQSAWKRYRGGQTTAVWIAELATSRILARIPRHNSNDFDPMWVGDKLYFLSDRNGPVSLFCYDVGSRKVVQVVKNQGLD